MPIDPTTIPTTPYEVQGNAIGNGTLHRAEHHIYTAAQARVALNNIVHPMSVAMRRISGTLDLAGDAIYLKFFNNKITSVRLPIPPPAGVDCFFTDNMSGCKFYVDRITGSQDVIVYHANTTANGPGPNALAHVQTAAANTQLDNYHTNAQGDYLGLVLNNAASLAKPAYYQRAGALEMHKRTRFLGRRSPTNPARGARFVGGCTIVGFPAAGKWNFYYQTWGDVGYARPSGFWNVMAGTLTFHWKYLHRLRTRGRVHQAGYATMRVVDYGQFF